MLIVNVGVTTFSDKIDAQLSIKVIHPFQKRRIY